MMVRIVWIGMVFGACLAMVACAQPTQNHYKLTTKGNLVPTQNPGCITYQKADNTLTPADLSLGILTCADQGNYHDLVDLNILMRLRGAFDGKRVADNSAAQAIIVLRMNTRQKLGPARLEKFIAVYKEFAFDGSTRHRNLCSHLRKSGPPNYVPDYMIQHGIWAFTKPEAEPLLADFNAEKTWQDLLDSSLKCS